MPLDLHRFIQLRPFLYHLTALSNVDLIRASGALHPAAESLTTGGAAQLLRTRRGTHEVVSVDGKRVHIRDQSPLHRGNVTLDDGWSFDDFVDHLNRHVFFWPGSVDGPIEHGRRHFQRNAAEDTVVFVLRTEAVLSANPTSVPYFCRYNSGAPRCSGGAKSPRGADTFQTADSFPRTAGAVVEVVFNGRVSLPVGDIQTVPPRTFL